MLYQLNYEPSLHGLAETQCGNNLISLYRVNDTADNFPSGGESGL
jgi:hypothetical protein